MLLTDYSVTLGDNPNNVTIYSSPSFFTENNDRDNLAMIYNYSHEVGHIKQIERDGKSYVLNCMVNYIESCSHDMSPYEIEANYGYYVLKDFSNYLKEISWKKNLLTEIINSTKVSEEKKIEKIKSYWGAYMQHRESQFEKQLKISDKDIQNQHEAKSDATSVK